MKWYDQFAEAVGDARVVIAFEPDSLGTIDCLARAAPRRPPAHAAPRRRSARRSFPTPRSTSRPARRTGSRPSAPPSSCAAIGINKVRGFMLNVTHHDWTRYNIQHGLDISRSGGRQALHRQHELQRPRPAPLQKWINRSQHMWRRINVWCHPGLRGLGPAPTTATSHPLVDAYMYINRPGYSAGACNGGPLPIGTWWADRGLMYASYATDWEAPAGAAPRYGHYKRYSLRALGAFGWQPGARAPDARDPGRRARTARAPAPSGSGSAAARRPARSRRSR